MLTDPNLKSKVDQIWEKLWTGGLSNPMDAIEQFSFLLFLKRLDESEDDRERQAKQGKIQNYQPLVPPEMRWREWTNKEAKDALEYVRTQIFPWLKQMGNEGSSFKQYMQGAEFKINNPRLLIEACNAIAALKISEQNQDVQGDLYEYLLSKLSISGRNGQFRTPRHIIRMMVEMREPTPRDRIADLAAGTCGFLVNAYQYILESYTSPDILYDDKGQKELIGELLSAEEEKFLQNEAFTAYDNDSGMTMLRIGSMNLMLHGIEHPRFFYMDTLSKEFTDKKSYDLVLMNPPFKGKIAEKAEDKSANGKRGKQSAKGKLDLGLDLPTNCTKSELLFLHLILRVLDMGGRCAVIVPDGVLFGSSKQHQEIRKKIVEENRLDGVVSMPSGVFKPYAGVSTAVLLFTRGGTTDKIWFYDMEHDGFSLDDKRQPVAENDIPDILTCWKNRFDADFNVQRAQRLTELKLQTAPLKAERLILLKEINRLTFENAVAPADDEPTRLALEADRQRLAQLHEQMAPLQAEINQLNRQFWVTKAQVKANKYDLSASRYRQIEQDEPFYELPQVTMERLLKLEQFMAEEVRELNGLLK